MDSRILELLARTQDAKLGGMWLRPTTIAKNLDASRQWITQRLHELETRGYVEHDGGYYRITGNGVDFITD